MDTNYSYNSYPESGGSSPRSREIDFDNPPPWEDQSNNNTNYKVKLMCSYGGKIHPRPHDNQLAYIGGETKILAVDRSIKFSALLNKLSAITDAEVSFKYQLPGEDLDALISVTNDDDLDHMMNEYDRSNRASPKPARLRIFLFPVPVLNPVISPANSFSSIEGRSDRDRFVEALNTGPVPVQSSTPAVLPVYGNADFLNIAPAPGPVPVPVPVQVSVPAQAPVTKVREFLDVDPDGTDRIQKHIHDLRQLRIAEDQQQQQQQQQMMYRRQSEDSMTSGYGGDYYRQTEKVVTTALPGSVPAPVSGYQMSGGFTGSSGVGDQQPVYMVPSSGGVYHAPMARPVTGPIGPGHGHGQVHGQGQGQQGQGYYAVYNGMQPVQQQMAQQQQQQQLQKVVTHSEGIRMVQSTVGMTDQGYGQVAYDNGAGRHVYYTPQGAMVAPHQQQQPQQMQQQPQMQPQPQPQPQQMQQQPQLQPQPQQMQQATHQYQAMGAGLGTLSQDGKVIAPTKNSQG